MISEMRLIVQVALGLVFALSVSTKLLNPGEFVRGVVNYEVLPKSLAYFVGVLLIPMELFLAISHLMGWFLPLIVPVGLVTLVTFSIAVGVNLRRGRRVPCHCFGGKSGDAISGKTLARLALLIVGELFLLSNPSLVTSIQPVYAYKGDLEHFALLLFWAMFLLVVGSWLLSVGDIIELVRQAQPKEEVKRTDRKL